MSLVNGKLTSFERDGRDHAESRKTRKRKRPAGLEPRKGLANRCGTGAGFGPAPSSILLQGPATGAPQS